MTRTGTRYFSNSASVRLPSSIVSGVAGVVGLSNTVRLQSLAVRPAAASAGQGEAGGEVLLVVRQLRDRLRHHRRALRLGHQQRRLRLRLRRRPRLRRPDPVADQLHVRRAVRQPEHRRAPASPRRSSSSPPTRRRTSTPGRRTTTGSATPRRSRTSPWTAARWPRSARPATPARPQYNGYSGDVEVDADIEITLAVAPDVKHLIVYNAPNDYTGQTELDEYTAIANQDVASTISSSWGECENDVRRRLRARPRTPSSSRWRCRGSRCSAPRATPARSAASASDGTTVVNVNDPSIPAVGDQRRRHLVRGRQPRHQLRTRAPRPRAPRPSGTSTTSAATRRPPPTTTTRAATSGAPRPARAAAVPASSGAVPSTSADRA